MPNKHLKNHKVSPKLPNYYQKNYVSWYNWFSHIYDPFVKVLFFILNGGFGGEKRWRQLIMEWIDPQSGERIIDICCGTGTLSLMLGERLAGAGEVMGIDLSPKLLNIARKKQRPQGVTFLRGDAQAIPFADGSFHRGVICGALHEMPHEVRQRVLGEAHRVIRPNGRMVFVEHNEPKRKWKRSLFGFLERFNPEYPTYKDLLERGLTDEIERGGFRVVRTDVTSWDFFQIVLAERQGINT
jgi:demethylmenaquinone methyltransferase/2-methoxy-6-polyprenyl-1,4-benzoquinol methylase